MSSIFVYFLCQFCALFLLETYDFDFNSEEELADMVFDGGQNSIFLHAFFQPLYGDAADGSFICFCDLGYGDIYFVFLGADIVNDEYAGLF